MINPSSLFFIKDCALATIATGCTAQTLQELHDQLMMIHPDALYFHFWGGRLRTDFERHEYHNDFSYWSQHFLHDDILAERLELINPAEHENIEGLRNDLLEIIENRLDEREFIPWTKGEEAFHFIRSTIVIFNTHFKMEKPEDLMQILPVISRSSIFYHFIDASCRLSNRTNDFITWLQGFGNDYQPLIKELSTIDPYFISLTDLQKKLVTTVNHFFIKTFS